MHLSHLAGTFAAVLSGAWLGGHLPASSIAATFARINEKRVEVLDLRRGTWRAIYRTAKYSISDLSVGPSGDRVAVLSWTKGTVTGVDYSKLPRAELVVIDTSGRTLATVPDVHKYDWCGSERIAYLQGKYSEDADWGFSPDGRMGLLDISRGKTTPLKGPGAPTAVAWNPLDSAVYLRDRRRAIYRLDLATGALDSTGLHDMQFSPSGRHYLHWPLDETNSYVVYQTRTNARVDLSSFLRTAQVVGWAGPSGDVLLAVRRVPTPRRKPEERGPRPIKPSDIRPQRYLLYRLSDGRVLAEAEGFLHGWAGAADRRLVRQGEEYKVLEGH